MSRLPLRSAAIKAALGVSAGVVGAVIVQQFIIGKSVLGLVGLLIGFVLLAAGLVGLLLSAGEFVSPFLKRIGAPRFSLRTMLIVCTLIALAIGLPRRNSIAQHYAVKHLERPGISLICTTSYSKQSRWDWLVFGDDKHGFIDTVRVVNVHLSPRDIDCLCAFPRLSRLYFEGRCSIDDVALKRIGSIHSLEVLRFEPERLSTPGLDSLAQLLNLEELRVSHVSLADVELNVLRKLPKLAFVNLRTTKDTDRACEVLSGVSLQGLTLADTDVTDDGLARLHAIGALEQLEIIGSQLKGTGFEPFAGHQKLFHLRIRSKALSREGLTNISRIQSLRFVDLRSTRVNLADIMSLRDALPNCTVLYDKVPEEKHDAANALSP